MSDITELPDMGKWFRALLDAFDALKAQAKEMEEFRDTASKHMSFWINLHQKQTARIAELEAENKTSRLALEASVAFAKHVQEFLYINDYGDYELGSGFENNTDETIKAADAALKGKK
jgi:phage terminase large subunit-like protein